VVENRPAATLLDHLLVVFLLIFFDYLKKVVLYGAIAVEINPLVMFEIK
jgi:hypothetical protein